MKRKMQEWLSVQIAKRPGRVVLIGIFIFNIVFFIISSLVISQLSVRGTEKMPFIQAAFSTITMILDPGCVQFVIEDIGQIGVAVAITCLLIIFVGMISFTGAVIGYITNTISAFIVKANAGSKELKISDHVVILNWNTRASEIINDLLFCEKRQKVVVLVNGRKTEIEKEIIDRLSDTVEKENIEIREKYGKTSRKFKNKVTVIVREGDVFSSKQLHDISLERARMVIILGSDINNSICKYEHQDSLEGISKGNSHTIKTLMQVADITGAEYSNDNQRIVVEITDEWTKELVDRIIKCKQVEGKSNIIPVEINTILGQILSQFSLMPELNYAYRELFSNKGDTFYAKESSIVPDADFIPTYLKNHLNAIPLTHMISSNGKSYAFYTSDSEESINLSVGCPNYGYTVQLNRNYWIEKKTVIILGHNSRCKYIMEGFCNFRSEWNGKDGSEILQITVIDDKESLERLNHYKEYPFVTNTIAASIYDRDIICSAIEEVVSTNTEDTSILILSDDKALNKDIDANALANLVYVQDIINNHIQQDANFDKESIDVIVEIIDPKHHDIVNSYSVNNVVISNRYISKMITQIGEKEALFEFYKDMLTYDTDISNGYQSKEIYAKKISRFFDSVPKPCNAAELIRAVYKESVSESIPLAERYPTIVLGYVKPEGKMVLFSGNQSKINVELTEKDKLIVYSVH